MGRLLQLLFSHRRENLVNMLRIVAVLVLASVAQCAPGGGHFAYGHQQKHCHTKYNIKYEQACHEEYDVVVDTTYIEECQDIITTHCQETSQQVHHSSAVVGKREAEPGYSTGPQCHNKKDRQCHKKPVQSERKIPRTVCVPYEVKVPYEVCGHSHVHVEQYANGYAHGYGH